VPPGACVEPRRGPAAPARSEQSLARALRFQKAPDALETALGNAKDFRGFGDQTGPWGLRSRMGRKVLVVDDEPLVLDVVGQSRELRSDLKGRHPGADA